MRADRYRSRVLFVLAACTTGSAVAQPEPSPQPNPETNPDVIQDRSRPAPAVSADPDQPRTTRRYGFFSGDYNPASSPKWRFDVEPAVWYVAPSGEVEFGSGDVVESDDLNVDSPGLSPRAEVHGRFGRYTLTLNGSLIEASGNATLASPAQLDTVSFSAGDEVATKLRLDSASVQLGYRVAEFGGRPNDRGLARFFTHLDVIGGVRFYDFGFSATAQNGAPRRVSSSITHAEPLIGFRYGVEIDRKVYAEAEVNFGWTPELDDQGSRSGSIQAAVNYRPVPSVGLQMGYQLRTTDLYDGDAEFSGAVAGIFAGLSVRF